MRELNPHEISSVGGALNFTSNITFSTINSVADATTVGRMLTLSFGVGYAIGTFLNNKYDLSTKIVDFID